jgi:hypothetical protein
MYGRFKIYLHEILFHIYLYIGNMSADYNLGNTAIEKISLNFGGPNTLIPAFSISPKVIIKWHLPRLFMIYFRTNPEVMKAAVFSVTLLTNLFFPLFQLTCSLHHPSGPVVRYLFIIIFSQSI